MPEGEKQTFSRAMPPATDSRQGAFGTKLVLAIGFGGLLALMSATGFDSLRALYRLEAGHARITRDYLERRHALERIRSQLFLAGAAVREFLTEPDAGEAGQRRSEILRLKQEIERDIHSYSSQPREDERALLTDLRSGVQKYFDSAAPALGWSEAQRRTDGYEFLRTRVAPQRRALARIAAQIGDANDAALDAGNHRAAALFTAFRGRMTLMFGATLGLGVLLAGLSAVSIVRLENEARLRYREAAAARSELQELSARLVEAQEEERRAISRELHDETGQALSAVLVDLSNLATGIPREDSGTHARLETMRKLVQATLDSIRNISLLLRPSMLDDFGLAPALEWQAREAARRSGIRVEVDARQAPEDLPEELKTCVYRVVQEALHNCARHSGAGAAEVTVRTAQDALHLQIADDGRGFDASRTRGLGLLGIEERVRRLGGALQVQSQPGRGTRLTIALPLAAPLSGTEVSAAV